MVLISDWRFIFCDFHLQVYIHNEASIQSQRHSIVNGFLELSDRFDDLVKKHSLWFGILLILFNWGFLLKVKWYPSYLEFLRISMLTIVMTELSCIVDWPIQLSTSIWFAPLA